MKLNSIIWAIALGVALCGCSDGRKAEGTKADLGGIEIISLNGDWEEMGRQYGELAGDHLHHVDAFLKGIMAQDEAKAEAIRECAQSLFGRYPHNLRMFAEGCASTSGLTLEELKVINALEYAEGFFCSGIAVWDDYAKGSLVYGRNYDALSYAPVAEDVIVTVFHPSDGAVPTAIVGYAGELYAVNALNGKGLFVELNNGMPSGGYDIQFDRMASTTSLLQVMLEADDMEYMDAFLKSNRSFAAFIIGVADENEARAYEWTADATRRADSLTREGLMVMTNHYVNPDWSFPTPADSTSWNSLTRRSNLCALAERHKGEIDAEMMCRLISTPIEEGGPCHELTRYQIVYEPLTRELRIRIEDAPQWTRIDMNEYL